MHTKLAIRCMDVNSEYCPCLLSETNHCMHCSQLQGKEFCDCDWAGMCVFYEKHWQKACQQRNKVGLPIRVEAEGKLLVKRQLSAYIYELIIEVMPELANELTRSGAFVFLHNPADPQFCGFPVAVMSVSENRIRLMIEADGPKSERFIQNTGLIIKVRGPYYNGILGQPWIDQVTCGKILLIAGGIGQAPALSAVSQLLSGDNQVIAILAPGKAGLIFTAEEMRKLGAEVHIVSSMRRDGINLMAELLSDQMAPFDLLFSSGPDEQHYGAIAVMRERGIDLPLAVTNNVRMCCGEGLCGSCEKLTTDDQRLRVCKVQTDFMKFVREDSM